MVQKKHKSTRPYGGIDANERQKGRKEIFIKSGLESFGTTGYVRSTIKEICRIAGLTQRYFYESFDSKEDLLVAVYWKLIEDIETEVRTILEDPSISAEDAVFKAVIAFYQRLKDDPRGARILFCEMLGVSDRVDRQYRSAMKKLSDWISVFVISVFPGLKNKWQDIAIIQTGAVGAVTQIAHQWMLGGFKTPTEEIAAPVMEAAMALGNYYQSISN